MTGQKLRANDEQTVQMTRRRVLIGSVSVRKFAIDQQNQRFSLAAA